MGKKNMKKIYFLAVSLLLTCSITFAQNQQEKVEKASSAGDNNSTSSTVTYDFTTGSDKFYGGSSGAVELETGVWGMIAGDPNANGAINATDYLIVQPDIGASGYQNSDVNLNGAVNATDYLVIQPNIGKGTQVP